MIYALVAWPLTAPIALAQRDLRLDRLQLPPGFVVDVVARVNGARAMTWGTEGTLFVGSSGSSVYAVRWPQNDMSPAGAHVTAIGSGLKAPIGVAFRDVALYASSVDSIVRFDAIESHLDAPPSGGVAVHKLPGEMHHGGRSIAFGPDG